MEEGASAMSTVISALTTGLTTVANDILGAIGSILPIALPIMGAMIVIGVAYRTFKKAKD